jgi:hypothetical protein
MISPQLSNWHSDIPTLPKVYHNNVECWAGMKIPVTHRLEGTGDKQLCAECAMLNKQAKASAATA